MVEKALEVSEGRRDFIFKSESEKDKVEEDISSLEGLPLKEGYSRVIEGYNDKRLGDRDSVLSREMTKRHEEFIRGPLSVIIGQLKDRPTIKGEITLLVSGAGADTNDSLGRMKKELESLIAENQKPLSEIVKAMAKKYSISRNTTYKEALEMKKKLKK